MEKHEGKISWAIETIKTVCLLIVLDDCLLNPSALLRVMMLEIKNIDKQILLEILPDVLYD